MMKLKSASLFSLATGGVILLFPLTMATLAACAQLGIAAPQTFNDKIALAVRTADAVVTTTDTLLLSKAITTADAQNVSAAAHTAQTGIALAQGMSASDPTGASTKLDAVISTLVALQAYEASKGK